MQRPQLGGVQGLIVRLAGFVDVSMDVGQYYPSGMERWIFVCLVWLDVWSTGKQLVVLMEGFNARMFLKERWT